MAVNNFSDYFRGLRRSRQILGNNPFNQSGQQPQQQQNQQQPPKQEKSDGVAGWIKDMFGGN